MDAMIRAALDTFGVQETRFLALIAGLPTDALDWRPGPGTNSLAVLTIHTWSAADAWMTRAIGQEIARDREAEFQASADATTLTAFVQERATRVRVATQTLEPPMFAALRTRADGEAFTVAYCLIHALEHTQEHLGQALLTRQLWEQAQGRTTMPEDDDGYRLSVAASPMR